MKQYKDTPYFITDDGKVFRNDIELKGFITKKGYRMIQIYKQKKYIHRLVGELYLDNPDNKPQINHIDGDKLNNHVSNLEWVTNQENRDHAILNGLHTHGEDCYNSKLTKDDVKFIRDNYIPKHREFSGVALSKRFGVGIAQISRIINNTRWKHL